MGVQVENYKGEVFYFKSSCKANDIAQLCLASARATESFFPIGAGGRRVVRSLGQCSQHGRAVAPGNGNACPDSHFRSRFGSGFGTIWAQTQNLAPIDLH